MVVILGVAFICIIPLAIWLKRRHDAKIARLYGPATTAAGSSTALFSSHARDMSASGGKPEPHYFAGSVENGGNPFAGPGPHDTAMSMTPLSSNQYQPPVRGQPQGNPNDLAIREIPR